MRALIIFFMCLLSSGLALGQQLPECVVPKPDPANTAAVKSSLEKLRSQCIPQVKEIDRCLTQARLLTGTIADLLRKFRPQENAAPLLVNLVANGRSATGPVDYNVLANFRALERDYLQSLDEIEKFAIRAKVAFNNREKIRDKIADLDRGFQDGIELLRSLSAREYALLSFIELARDEVIRSYEQAQPEALWLAGPACELAQTKLVVAKVQSSIQEFIADTDKIHQTIRNARSARENLITYIYASLRSQLEDAYRESLSRDLSGLGNRIDTVIHLHRLSTSFELWFSSIGEDPERNYIETTYLQFDASRRLYAADLIAAKDFRDRVRIVSNSFPDLGKPYLERVGSVISNLEGKLKRVETKGWQGFLASQKLIASRRLASPEKYTPSCVNQLQRYLNQAERIQSIDRYRSVENLFMKASKICMVPS